MKCIILSLSWYDDSLWDKSLLKRTRHDKNSRGVVSYTHSCTRMEYIFLNKNIIINICVGDFAAWFVLRWANFFFPPSPQKESGGDGSSETGVGWSRRVLIFREVSVQWHRLFLMLHWSLFLKAFILLFSSIVVQQDLDTISIS